MKFKIEKKLKVEQIDTWAAPLEDKPGSLAKHLQALAIAGVNLGCVIARRAPEKPGAGVVFVTPIEGEAGIRAAHEIGFEKTGTLHTVRVEGRDRQGAGGHIAQVLAEKGINLRGFSAAAIDKKFVAYVAVDTDFDAESAMQALREM